MAEMSDLKDQENGKGRFKALLAGADFKFNDVAFDNRHVSVREILRKTNHNPTQDYRLVQLTFPGTKSLDDDETIDLKAGEPLSLVVGQSDRLYAFSIDEVIYELPFDVVSEANLRHIASIDDDKMLFVENMGTADRELSMDDKVSFEGRGVERIYSQSAMVRVCYEGKNRDLPRGKYLMKELIEILGVASGNVLSYVNADEALVPFREDEALQLIDGMKFFNCPAGGGSS